MTERYISEYWDKIFTESPSSDCHDLWRANLRGVLQELLKRWSFTTPSGIMLKTDLYEEATSQCHLFPLLKNCCKVFYGVDVSPEIVRSAYKRVFSQHEKKNMVMVSDVRNLRFKSELFDKVISNSTLDHFTHKNDIATSLRELYRVLKKGGTLIITLDNPHNPVILLRNILPSHLLKRLNLIPYAMGVTLSQEALISMLESAGFKVTDKTFIAHAPRLLIIWGGYLFKKIGWKKALAYFSYIISLFERLQGTFFARFTGYFVAVKAIKP